MAAVRHVMVHVGKVVRVAVEAVVLSVGEAVLVGGAEVAAGEPVEEAAEEAAEEASEEAVEEAVEEAAGAAGAMSPTVK